MSVLCPDFRSYLPEGSTLIAPSLGDKKVSLLNTLLYEKEHNLFSKSSLQRTVAFTVNEIFQAIIYAYAATFEAKVEGSSSKTSLDILKEREITISFSIKGKTVACLLEEQQSSSDIDTTLDFSKIPLPQLESTSEGSIKAFFSSPAGRSYLKDYYVKVAEEATKALLRLNNEKTKIKNLILAASGIAPTTLIAEHEIEMLKDKFFSNLLLFTGNSTFLLSFGDVDFAIKVPYMNSSSCLHKADSLEIKIPLHPLTYHLLSQQAVLTSASLITEALSLLREKKISISEPHKIQFNGFERIMYVITQGWSVVEKESLYVLLQDFGLRSIRPQLHTDLVFERLYALLIKKMANGGISPLFALKLFLNAYMSFKQFANRTSLEIKPLDDMFQKAFLKREYLELFPSYISDNLPLFKDLNAVIFFEKLKLLIAPKKMFHFQVVSHLEKQTMLLGEGLKKQGCLLFDIEGISEILHTYQTLGYELFETTLNQLLSAELKPFENFSLTFKDKIRLLLFINLYSLTPLPLELDKQLGQHYEHFLAFIVQKPSLLSIDGFPQALIASLRTYVMAHVFDSCDVAFIKSLLVNTANIPIIPLFCEILPQKDHNKIEQALDFSFKRIDSPVLADEFINFLLLLPEKTIEEHKVFKIIEQTLKVSKIPLSSSLLFHPKIYKVLKKQTAHLLIDRSYWTEIFNQLLLAGADPYFLEIYYHLCSHDPRFLEDTFSYLNQDIKWQIFKKILKDQKQDLVCIFILHNGLNPVILSQLIKEEVTLFKNKVFKNALLTLSQAQFNYIIEQLLSLSDPKVGEVLIILWEQKELFIRSQMMMKIFIDWAEKYCINKDFFFHLLKMSFFLPEEDDESTALLLLQILKYVIFSEKSVDSVFQNLIERFYPIYLKLEITSSHMSVKTDILELKKKTASLMSLGYVFPNPWISACALSQKEAKSIQEALATYNKAPDQMGLFACLQCLQAQKKPLEEEYIQKLKQAFSAHESYLLELIKYIKLTYPEGVQQRLAKDVFASIRSNDIKFLFLESYIEGGLEPKHLIFMSQSIDFSLLSRDKLIMFLDKIFMKSSDEIKTMILLRLKENFFLNFKNTDILFEFFKNIKGAITKKSVLFDYFITCFCKLTAAQQQELIFLPLALDSSESLSLITRACSQIKYLDSLNQIINKRGDKDCYLSDIAFLEMALPIFDKIISQQMDVEAKHYPIVLNFIEKVIALFKENKKDLASSYLDKMLILLDKLPLHDILRDVIVAEQKSLPRCFVIAFLDKRQKISSFNKSDSEKYYKILSVLLEDESPELIFEYFKFFNSCSIFNINQKSHLFSLIIAKAIEGKKADFIDHIFGTKVGVGFLEQISKSSKKILHEALSCNFIKASSLEALNLEVLKPLKSVMDGYGSDFFITLKESVKIKVIDLLTHNLKQADSLASLDANFMVPLQTCIPYFGSSCEVTALFTGFIEKLKKGEVRSLFELGNTIEGFDQVLSRIALMINFRCLEKNTPIFDISLEEVKGMIVDCLYEKMITTNPTVYLVTMLNRVKLFSPGIARHLLTNIAKNNFKIVLDFMASAKEGDLIILFKLIGKCEKLVYERMATVLMTRVITGNLLSVTSFIYPLLNSNFEFCDFLITSLKNSKVINIETDLLKVPLEIFIHMMSRYFDFETQGSLCSTLLERKRLVERMAHYKYFLFLKNSKTGLEKLYLSKASTELKASFYEELELTRIFSSQPIIEYCQYICSEDSVVATMYLDYYGFINPSAILNEIKSVSFQNYYKQLFTIYNIWILNHLHKELYLEIANNAIDKLEGILGEVRLKGELDLEQLKSLYKALNFLSLSYDAFFASTSSVTKDRFNAVFLNLLIILLQSNKLIKEYDYYATSFFNILNIIKASQIEDILNPVHFVLIDQFMKSALKLFTIGQLDYIKEAALNKADYEATILWQKVVRENIFLHLTQHWIAPMGIKNIDLFLQFFIMSHLIVNPRSSSKEGMQMIYNNLFLIAKGYISKFESGYKPKKSESVLIDQVLELFNPKLCKSKRESNVMIKLYEIDPEDLEGFKFYTCCKILQDAQKIMVTG